MGFELDGAMNELNDILTDLAENNVGKKSVILRKVTLDVLKEVVQTTRVDLGGLWNNWQVSRNVRLIEHFPQAARVQTPD